MLKCVFHSGGQCASFGLVIRQEKGQQGYSLYFCHAHNLCGKPPRDAPGDMGKLLLSLQPLSKCCSCPLQQWNPTLVLRLSMILHLLVPERIDTRYKHLPCVTWHSGVVSTGLLRFWWHESRFRRLSFILSPLTGQSNKARQLSSTSPRWHCASSIVLMQAVVGWGYSRSHDVSGYTVTCCCSWVRMGWPLLLKTLPTSEYQCDASKCVFNVCFRCFTAWWAVWRGRLPSQQDANWSFAAKTSESSRFLSHRRGTVLISTHPWSGCHDQVC